MKGHIIKISLILLLAFFQVFSGEVSAGVYMDWGVNTKNPLEISHDPSIQIPSSDLRIPINSLPENRNAPFTFPEGDSLVLFAGNDTTVCLSELYIELSGEAQNFYFTSWATTGDGFFIEATPLNTQYFPGPLEIANGLVDLYLVGINVQPQYFRMVDSIKVSIVERPACFAGLDSYICEGDAFQPDATASSFSMLLWNTSGDGTFDYVDILNPTYFHGDADLTSGEVTLELTALPTEPCVLPEVNQMTLYITTKPAIYAGNDTILCAGQNLQLNTEIPHNTAVYWSSTGDGSFSNILIPDPVYFPGPQDIQNAGCVINATALPVFPCEAGSGDDMIVEIVSPPSVSLGDDVTICENESVACDVSVGNFESLFWMVLGGNGFFEDPTQANTIYHPGAHEKNTGIFFILLQVSSLDPCISTVSDYFKVDLINQAVISAGPDQLLCSNDTASLYGFGENYTGVYWETFGDGTFIGDEQLYRKYVPGLIDIQNGYAMVFACAGSNSPCDLPVCDTLNLVFQNQVIIDAGSDATICQDHMLSAVAENYLTLQWTTSGDGTFENQNAANAVYHAGPDDIENLTAVLSLVAEPQFPCEAMAIDELQIKIDRPVVQSGPAIDHDILIGGSVSLNLEVIADNDVFYQWYREGEMLVGRNGPQLVLNNCQPGDAGRYYCMYWNNCFTFSGDTSLVSVLVPKTQTIEFSAGWNAVSTYVLPNTPNIELLLSPVIEEILILYGNEGIFYPGQDVQTFTNWSSNSGYILKTTSADDLTIQGVIKYPKPQITLQPGWSILPVGQNCSIAPQELFENHTQIAAIKEIGGFRMYWPAKNIYTLENINPGKAYEVFNASDEEVSFTFPGCDD